MNFPFPDSLTSTLGISQDAMLSIEQDFMQAWKRLSDEATQGQLPPIKDRRFSNEDWAKSPQHLMMAHLYLLSSQAMQRMVDVANVPPEMKDRLQFSTMQFVDAMSPANFFATNPEAQAAVVRSGGETLRAGMLNLMTDLQKGRISQTDESQFVIGENVATTPGSVVFQNRFIQLIQYAPLAATVYQRPLLIVPPCINKYYIFDLQPGNSLARYTAEQGFTVYMISWRNPVPEDKDDIDQATWDDYLEFGVLEAISVIQQISGQSKINALGFCVGGTLLATALALAAGRGSEPVAALTMVASMLDFTDTGTLSVFVDEQHATMREKQIGQGGLMSARELGATFSFLRPNELVWNYVVSNYLKGEKPAAFDLLFWNSDGTNLPGPFFTWYFRNTYLENNLCQPNKLKCSGVPIDLRKIKVPTYIYASREDHIVPWKSGYASTGIFSGKKRFVLGASGHVAGVINPPAKKKRNYWVGPEAFLPHEPDQWFEQATEMPGSWWSDWSVWLTSHSGKKLKAPKAEGHADYPVIEAAPGSFVKVRAV